MKQGWGIVGLGSGAVAFHSSTHLQQLSPVTSWDEHPATYKPHERHQDSVKDSGEHRSIDQCSAAGAAGWKDWLLSPAVQAMLCCLLGSCPRQGKALLAS